MIGKVFERLTVIEEGFFCPNGKSRLRAVKCQCSCGNALIVPISNLNKGRVSSCGCIISDKLKGNKNALSHGQCDSPTYISWYGMKDRCSNPNNNRFKHYGERGIKVCERWNDFENFLEDMGERPQGKTLDRIDVNGDYELANCRWASPKEQAANKRL